MKRPKATPEQIQVAKEYGIPVAQAHTVNLDKVAAYRAFKESSSEKINDWLDRRIDYGV